MSKASLRVYFSTHHDGRLTGTLLRTRESFFDRPPPSAYGVSEESVLKELEYAMQALLVSRKDELQRYLWEEDFSPRAASVEINPASVVKKQPVIGKRQVPFRLTYVYSKMKSGAYRVMLPRFSWWFILEDLEIASDTIKNAISSALLGENPKWLYDFRFEGREFVREWAPASILKTSADPSGASVDDESAPEVLADVAEEWVRRSKRGKLGPLVAMDDIPITLLRAAETFPPPSILLVGPSGVGKTTWVRRLARQFASRRKTDGGPHTPKIWATSADRIIAGMVYLGMWQKRCLDIVQALSFEGDYLFVDRLTDIIQRQSDGTSIADILGPPVVSEEISLIAECDESELEQCRRAMPALVSAMRIVRLTETSVAELPRVLSDYQTKTKGKPKVHPEGMKRLGQHLTAFSKSTAFPGKGFRFLDWLHRQPDTVARLYPKDVSKAYAKYSGLSADLISDDTIVTADQVASKLRSAVIGQDDACSTVARVLARFKAGMNDPERPLGSLFFVGPTGVGKTELAKQLTRYLFGDEKRMIRLDMSEYMAPGSASRMMAVGKGVTSLAEQVRQQPLSLVLLDEIEKAHPETFDLLLGILGEGRLTDALGRFVDFRMTLIVMTSNLGVRTQATVGFDAPPEADYLRSVRQHFRPELFNRIDHVLSFRALAPEDIERIVDLELDKASARKGLTRRGLSLDVTPEARRRLAELGYHRTYGARPLKRVLEERVMTPLAVQLAKDPSLMNRKVQVGLVDGEPRIVG